MPFSIHTVRWIELLKEQDWEIHFFSSFPYAVPHKQLSNVIYHDFFYNIKSGYPASLDYRDFSNKKIRFKNQRINKLVGKGYRFLNLQKSYQTYFNQLTLAVKPDIIHSMESQHAGYIVSEFYQTGQFALNKRPIWIHSTWGLDIDYFQHFPEDLQKLKQMFSHIDIYLAEGERDIKYSKALGFKNKTYIFPSVAGGYKINTYPNPTLKTSQRKKILIKGEQDSVRRGLMALRALVRCKDIISNYEVVVYSAAKEVKDYVQYINSKENLKLRLFKSGTLLNWLQLLAEARISVNNNLSDGNPSSLFEAMLMGVFPIQSENSCAGDWINDGVSGFLTPAEDPEIIEKAIRMALTDDLLIDKAAEINYEKVSSALNFTKVQSESIRMYCDAFNKEGINSC